MVSGLFSINKLDFLLDMGLSLLANFLITTERESKGKPAGIGIHWFVIESCMLFTYIFALVDPNSIENCYTNYYMLSYEFTMF
jgi:uncharacterized membrane protein YhiD involved in acid resistance